MNKFQLALIAVLLCIVNYTISQESGNYANDTDNAFLLNNEINTTVGQNEILKKNNSEGKNLDGIRELVPLKPLYELFTSSTCGPCVAANEILTEVLDANPDEYALIKYQMNWPNSGDPYYTQEGGVRRGYYGVSFVPDLYINSDQLDPASSITQEIFDQYAGMMTSMEIEITEAYIDEDNIISIDVELMPLDDYAAGLVAHIVVVEKDTYNNVGTNGETEFGHVMMKMLPDASGTTLGELTSGNQIILSETFDMDETYMETPNDLVVVVFVQDNTNKSIVQSSMLDVEDSFDSYNVSYTIEDVNGNPIEGAHVQIEYYGTHISDESGHVVFEEVLPGAYDYSVYYAGLMPHSDVVNVIDEDIEIEIILEHYTSLLETFSSGIPSIWTKHVGESNYLFSYSGKVKFARFSFGDENPLMLISPAVEITPSDTLSFDHTVELNNPELSFGIISDPFDPASFTELAVAYPEDEWDTYKYALSSLAASDTVVYFAWSLESEIESSFFLDNVFLLKEGVYCLPIYNIGCSNYGMGFTDFALEQIENYDSDCADLNGTGYSQYLELGPAELLAGETYSLSMATGYENIYASVWIDFNDDFVFSSDEMVVDNFWMEEPEILYEAELTIPAEAANGIHLMRTRTNWEDYCNDPCEEYYYGEAEEYLVQIGEFVPLKPLYELFTSSTCGPCVEANEVLSEVLNANPDEYALIKYQMSWPENGDPYYTEEGGVRRNYYGVNSVPDLYINADELDPASSISQEIFDQYAGMMTSMGIEITEATIDEENVISIGVELMPLDNYTAGLIAHIIVVEKKTYNNVGTNGETEFDHVMMKMLPDASGTALEELTAGSQVILSETFDMDETYMETPDDLVVVVFVQDNTDKSIVQSSMLDVAGTFETYNVTYLVEDVNGNPIEGAKVLVENYGLHTSGESGQTVYEEVLVGSYNYSINYAGLIPQSGIINVIDEDITQIIVLEHYTSLLETFNSGLPSSWTKHVQSGFLFGYSNKVKFFRSVNSGDDQIMLISPAVEVTPADTLSFEYGDVLNNPMLSFGIISDPYDPPSYTELDLVYPEDEWETYEFALNSIVSSDTVIYFAWNILSETESSFHLDNVFLNKEDEFCLPIYTQGCSYYGNGYTDFALEQIENYDSDCAELSGIGYSQYLELGPAELLTGETYSISMATGYENVNASVWIDFNDDYTFSADEMVVDNFLMVEAGIMYEVELTVPAEAAEGLHLMRARTNGDGYCDDPCEEYYYGEAEEYMIQINEEMILPPTNLSYELSDSDVVLEWDAPQLKELVGYNVYYSYESEPFEVLANVTEATYTHESPDIGLHQYYVTAVYSTGESDPTNTVEVLITGIENQPDRAFQIYPNPASDIVNISSNFIIKYLSVYNHSGHMVCAETINNRACQYNVSRFSPGLYFFRIETTEGVKSKRIVIE